MNQPHDDLASLEPLLAEYAQVEQDMASPATLADPARLRRVGRRYAELGRVKAATTWARPARSRRRTPPSPRRCPPSRRKRPPPTRR